MGVETVDVVVVVVVVFAWSGRLEALAVLLRVQMPELTFPFPFVMEGKAVPSANSR